MKSTENNSRGRGGGKWFLLGLAFLAINTYAVWKLTHKHEPHGAAKDGGPADAAKCQITPIAKPAKAGPI